MTARPNALIPRRVNAGFEWLNARRPQWDRYIELSTMSMAHRDRCVLSQVVQATHPHADWTVIIEVGVDSLWIDPVTQAEVLGRFGLTERRSERWAIEHGFTTGGVMGWSMLQSEWERRIQALWERAA